MDHLRRNHPLNSQATSNGSELKRRKDSTNKVSETDENEFPSPHNGVPTKSQGLKTELRKNALFSNTPSFKKKILAERKEDLLPDSALSGAAFHNSPISSHSYDPITNYTSPRPKFLRYNPNQRREILQRIEGENTGDEELWSPSSLSSPNSSSKREDDNGFQEGEALEEKKPFYCSYVVWSLLLIFGALLFISYCTSSSNPSFEGYENIQKIQGKTRKNLFPENLLGSLMSLSHMCPIDGESFCNFDENLFVSLEIDRVVGSEELGKGESLIDGIGRDLSNKPEVHDSVATEKMEQGDDQNERDFGTLSIVRAESFEENNRTSSSVESSLVSVVQDVREDDHNASLDSMEISSISQSRLDDSTPPNDQGLEDFNFSLESDTERKPDERSSIFFIFLCSLTVVVGLFSSFHKYFQRPELRPKTETGEKIVTNAPMEEQNLGKALDISVESNLSRFNSVSSTYDQMNVESKEVSGFGEARVELLGEFSLIDAGVTNNEFGSYSRKMENPNSQFSYNQRGKARKRLSPLSDMLDSSPEASTCSRFSSKVPADKGDISDTSATFSLRRSSRLRNRNRVI